MVYRTRKVERFVQVDNTMIYDERLSLKAKGLLLLMLSRPNDWVFYEDELVKHCTDGVSSLRSGLAELKDCGYLRKIRLTDEQGRVTGWETHVFETPQKSDSTGDSVQIMDSENLEVPDSGFSHTTKTDSTKTESTKNLKSATPPSSTVEEFVQAYNESRGTLPEVRDITEKRRRKIASVIKELGDERALSLVRSATLLVSQDAFWVKNRYNLDNLLNGTHLVSKAEKYEASKQSKARDSEAPF